MNHSKMIRVGLLFSLTALMLMIIAACSQATPQVQTVVETVVVKETVEVEKIVTVEVEKQVEVEAAAAECATMKDNYKIGFANLTEDIVFTQLVRDGIEKAWF